MEKAIALVFMLFVLLNEIVFGFNVKIGAAMYLVLMSVSLILLSRKEKFDDISKTIIIFLVVPLIRIVGLFMNIPYIWRLVLGYGILLFLGLYYLREFNINIGYVSGYLWMIPIIVCIGVLVGFFGNMKFAEGGNLTLIMVLPLVVFGEEIFFRGLMQNSLEKSCGLIYSLIVPAIVYGALSFHFGLGLAIFFLFVDLFSGFLYLSTRNIFLSIAFNLTVSIFVFVIPSLI